jgi:Ca-activated chloride channel family protein
MMSHRHIRSSILLVLLPSFAFAGSGDETPNLTYRTTTSEVRVSFSTSESNGHPCTVIAKDDFVIVDGDIVVREFRSLTRSDETALDVLLMMDASQSMQSRLPAEVNYAFQLLSQEELAANENLSVVAFAGLRPELICSQDCRSAPANQRLLSMKAAGPTPLFDTLAYGADFLSNRHAASVRPVLILLSDGEDTISKISARDALQALLASGALLYAIDLNNPGNASGGSDTLQRMANATGGRYFPPHDGLSDALQTAIEDLRSSYVVTYQAPSSVVGFHSLRILPKHNLNLRFHCRNGYYYGQNIQ